MADPVTVPPEAIDLALGAALRAQGMSPQASPWYRADVVPAGRAADVMRAALEAAAPHIAIAIRAEDAPRHHDAIWRQAAAAVYAERERIRQLAIEVDAGFSPLMPDGECDEVKFADLLREDDRG